MIGHRSMASAEYGWANGNYAEEQEFSAASAIHLM